MCDKDTCNDASCCGECEPWNCLEQQVNDILATKEDQLQGYVGEAKDAAAESKASAEASAQSAAESKEFRDEAETAASTAVAAEGVVLGVANTLQDTAGKLEQIADELGTAIAGVAVSSWFYTTISENQTVIPVPSYKNAVDVQSIYIEGARQSPFRGFEFDKTAMTITLAEPLPLGLEIEIILGTYNSDNPNDFAHTLASNNGASLVGTTTGKTVQEELNRLVEPAGATLYPDLQIARWRDEGDVRGWGGFSGDITQAINDAFAAVSARGGGKVKIPEGVFAVDFDRIPVGVHLDGSGCDYWDTYRPTPNRLLKSWDKGTTLLYTGTGAKTEKIYNLPNTRAVKTNSGGVSFPFTDFTLNDSVNGSPATPRPFSCAVKITRNSGLSNLRIMVGYNGIDGYNDASLTGLGDDWDVGLWVYDANNTVIENVQVVGYWRMAAILHTENDGTYDMVGNPEQTVFRNVYTQGRRGYLIRNSPQHRVISNTANTITAEYTSSWTLSHARKFRIFGNSTTYTFTGYSASGNQITLTGVTPALPANVTAIRAPNMGNNFSGSVFESCKFNSLEHTSGTPSHLLGLGEAGALEADGFPCRNIRLVGTKCQTVFDRLNSLFGDCRDWKFVAGAFENGAMVAYGYDETNQVGFTGNLRMGIETEIGDSRLDWSLFTPRDGLLADKQFPTQNTDGKMVVKNWQEKGLEIQFADGQTGLLLRDSDGYLRLYNGNGQLLFQGASNNAVTIQGNNVYIANAAGETILSAFTSTKNIMTAAALTIGGDAIAMANVRPNVANANTVGTAIFPFAGGFTQTAFQVTSDRRAKMDETYLDEAERRVAVRLKSLLKKYKLRTSVEEKGTEKARWHCGIIAQDIIQAFEEEGLDATSYAMLCHTLHAASEAIVEDDGTVISPAIEEGDSYTVRYEELYAFILAAM